MDLKDMKIMGILADKTLWSGIAGCLIALQLSCGWHDTSKECNDLLNPGTQLENKESDSAYSCVSQMESETNVSDTPAWYSVEYEIWMRELRLPPELSSIKDQLDDSLEFYYWINPNYLRGDFNGDGSNDVAILVRNRNGKVGLLIAHTGSKSYIVLGLGKYLYTNWDDNDDLSSVKVWYVGGKGWIEKKFEESHDLRLKGEAIFLENPEAASGFLYWDGKEYRWFQQGD